MVGLLTAEEVKELLRLRRLVPEQKKRRKRKVISEKSVRVPPTNDVVIADHFGLVGMVTKWLTRAEDDAEEIFNVGFLGLIHAAKWHDPSRAARFSTYAVECIKGTVLRWRQIEERFRLRRLKVRSDPRVRYVRLHLFSELHPSFIGGWANVFAVEPHDLAESVSETESEFGFEIESKLSCLSWRERKVIELRFGGDGKTLDAVGKELRISRERVRQIQARATRKLKREMTNGAKWDY